jgi:SAM-dependent methyltransferase
MADAAGGDYGDPVRARAYGKRPGTTRAEARVIRRLLGDLPAVHDALDVPCGSGRLAPVLAGLGIPGVTGVDRSLAMARLARDAGEASVQGDAGSLPFAARSADVVVGVRLLHHFTGRGERVRILREFARVTRGPVLVSLYRRWTLEGLRRRLRPKRPSTRVGLTMREVRRDAAEAGLTLVRYASLLPLVREQTFVLLRARESRACGDRASSPSP